jgi:iron complex transport system ATP-binding protein
MRLEIKNLSFSYGDHAVLDQVSFSADRGDLMAVLGPNGVGKSTLFRCVLGLLRGYQGEILCQGKNLHSIPPRQLAGLVAYVPQYSTPVFNYEVLELVMLGTAAQLDPLAAPKQAQRQLALDTLDSLGIAHLARRGVSQISGGERQMVLLARALVQQAKILVMDEPTANLDYGNQYRVMERIRRLAEEGYTILLSTHNPEHALLFANRVLALWGGRVLAAGDPDQVVTEALLEQLYGIRVRLAEVSGGDRDCRVCVPTGLKKS